MKYENFFKDIFEAFPAYRKIVLLKFSIKNKSLKNEIRSIIIDEEQFTESEYSFQFKPLFSTLGFIIKLSPQRSTISFVFDDIIRNILGFKEPILYKEYNPSPNPVVIFFHMIIFSSNVISLKE